MLDERKPPMSDQNAKRAPGLLVGAVVALFIAATLALGAWWGFPVQDDTYALRLLRLGGVQQIFAQHPDRPISGFLVATSMRFGGEHRVLYIALLLAFWGVLVLQAVRLWTRLFPEWTQAWPAIALGTASPVLVCVQFTTVSTLFPCVLPVVLILAGLLLLLARSDAGSGAPLRAAAVLLAAAAAMVSEYALAAAAASAVLLLVLGRWRGAATLLAGVAAGHAVFRSISDVTVRRATNPAVQIAALATRPWSRPFRVVAATWYGVVGSWGQAASAFQVDFGSKSTLVAALAALIVATCAASLRGEPAREADPAGRRLLAVIAAVAAGVAPAVVIQGWPFTRVYETRFFLPVLAFAVCGTMAAVLSLSRPRFLVLVVFAVSFVAADRLVLGAFAEKRLQMDLERFGKLLKPVVEAEPGLVVLVSPDRSGISGEEQMAKATERWGFPVAGRLWIMRPDEAAFVLGTRIACPDLSTLRLRPEIRWPRTTETISAVLWDSSATSDPDPEPYFRSCPAR